MSGISGLTDKVADAIGGDAKSLYGASPFSKRKKPGKQGGTTAPLGGAPAGFGSIKSYDTGTDLIPDDQLALLHQGEAVIPAEQNPANPENQLIADSTPAAGVEGLGKITGETPTLKPYGPQQTPEAAKYQEN